MTPVGAELAKKDAAATLFQLDGHQLVLEFRMIIGPWTAAISHQGATARDIEDSVAITIGVHVAIARTPINAFSTGWRAFLLGRSDSGFGRKLGGQRNRADGGKGQKR